MGGEHRFQVAAARAEAKFKRENWLNLSPRARADAIYHELREIDLAAARSPEIDSPEGLTREMRKAVNRVRVDERRVARQLARISEMQRNNQDHAVIAGRTLLGAMEARLELSRRRLRLLRLTGSK